MREAERAEAHDAVLLNGQGYTTETSSSNIFIVLEGKLYTPPLTSGCLAGITRGYVLELATELGIDSLQKDLELDQLKNSEGFFLTNSIQEIQPVKSLNGDPVNQSPVTSELQKVYRQKVTSATK